ncbi:MAG: 2-oxo acid dehydrogenase subunit E2 [Phycisphaerae bacterium]|nr:2-oxo acid dehydrogenase subunit E2 [Phycisphaerae bacterium]
MTQTIRFPRSEDCTPDATVIRWRKNPGDVFEKGDALVELAGVRATILVKAPEAGSLVRRLVEAGQTVPAGGSLADISKKDAHADGKNHADPTTTSKEKPMSSPKGPVIPVLMPQASNTMEEGTVVKWHVAEGDAVEVGQVIFEVETDKAAVEVEATDAGKLARIVVAEGDSIDVLKPVAYLADSAADVDAFIKEFSKNTQNAKEQPAEKKDESAAAPPPVAPAPPVAPPTTATPAVSSAGRVKASPAARRLAMQQGVDLAAVGVGSGPGGRIVSTDVSAAGSAARPAVQPAPASTGPIGEKTREKMSPMRKAIAKNLLASKQNIPHFYIERTIDAEPLMSYYRSAKAQYPCSVNDVVVLACGRAIAEFPRFRSRVDGEEFVTFPTANIGVAVGMDDGLVVPVVVATDRMNLQQVGAETRRIAERARAGKIEGLGQGVFTISNLGMFGVERFSAIINPPEAAILAVGAVREDVAVKNGAILPARRMTLTLSCDHRVIDGLEAAKFLARLKELLENPSVMELS